MSSKQKTIVGGVNRWKRLWPWFVLMLLIAAIVVIRTTRLSVALERDEGEYAYAGQLILDGIPPYKLAYNMKLPGTYAMYALIMVVFGQTNVAIHLGLLLVNVASIVLMYFLARRFFSEQVALIGAATFALISVSPSVLGFAAHATHFVVFFALAGILLLLRAVESQRRRWYLTAGIALGLAFVMKQPGAVFCAFGAIYLLCAERKGGATWRSCAERLGTFVAGAVIPFAITCGLLISGGVIDKFWFWTFGYARAYGTLVPLKLGAIWLTDYFRNDPGFSWPFWILGAVGLLTSFLHQQGRGKLVFLVPLFLLSFAGVSAGLYFRAHYFILVLPALALLVCAAFDNIDEWLGKWNAASSRVLPLICFAGVWIWVFCENRFFFFTAPNDEIVYSLYHGNPFKEAVTVGKYVREHSVPGDTVAIFGSEPEIFFYSGRHSATSYIYTYPLTEPHAYATTMQEEMIRQIEAAKPKFVVAVKAQFSWGNVPRAGQPLTGWMNDYLVKSYDRVLLLPIEETDTRPDANPQTEGSFVFVFQRRNG